VDRAGNVFVTNFGGPLISKIAPGGEISIVAGSPEIGSVDGTGADARFVDPAGIAVDELGNLYVADFSDHTIRKVTPDAVVTTLAGKSGAIGSTDGEGSEARFNHPWGICVDKSGNVYVVDRYSNTIRKISPTGTVTTFAGTPGTVGGDDGLGPNARFNDPIDAVVDGDGNVYVVQNFGVSVRKITPAGEVTTLAGRDTNAGLVDGHGSEARFYLPYGLGIDVGGNLYVADFLAIRKVTPSGYVTTLGGGFESYSEGGGTGSSAHLVTQEVAADAAGNIFVTDGSAGVASVLKGTPALSLANSGSNGGSFSFDIFGPTNSVAIVERTSDFTNWTPLSTNVLLGELIRISDPQNGNLTRTYRLRASGQ